MNISTDPIKCLTLCMLKDLVGLWQHNVDYWGEPIICLEFYFIHKHLLSSYYESDCEKLTEQ